MTDSWLTILDDEPGFAALCADYAVTNAMQAKELICALRALPTDLAHPLAPGLETRLDCIEQRLDALVTLSKTQFQHPISGVRLPRKGPQE